MGAVIRLLAIAVAIAAMAAPGAQADDTVYSAPYGLGPSGGDAFNRALVGEDGRITIGRIYPVPGAIGCSAAAGYAKYVVNHVVDAPVSAVTVAFTEALVDPYVIASAVVRDQDGSSIGYASDNGVAGDGAFEIDLEPSPSGELTALNIEFGLEVSSACPSVDAGTIRFSSVTVHEE